ncbi:CTL/SLC44 family protein [archaeon]|nr:MAG: CTL/SLC44 family protein [archaeon]
MDCMFKVKSKTFLNRCYPDTNVVDAAEEAADVADSLGVTINLDLLTYNTAAEKGQSWFSQTLADIIILAPYIGGFGLGVATLLSFGYLYLLRIPGLLFIMLWSVVLGIFLCLLIGSWLLWSLANSWVDDGLHSQPEITTMRVFSYIGMVMTVLYFCLIVVLRKRLNLAIGIIKQAARALSYMPTLMTMPIIQAVGIAIFLVPWVIYVIFLASSGTVETHQASYEYNGQVVEYSFRTFEYTTNTKYAFLYMLFSWFWTSEFLVAFGQLVIALAFTGWYFNRDKSKTGSATVRWAFKTTGIYHMGTAAFGSLIIAIIKTIRVVLNYIQRKAKKSKNKLVEYIVCVIACIVWCIEKIMKFVNKHAYIMTAIYGYSFCKAARAGFFLIMRNILRVAAVNMVSSFVLFIGRVCLCIHFASIYVSYIQMTITFYSCLRYRCLSHWQQHSFATCASPMARTEMRSMVSLLPWYSHFSWPTGLLQCSLRSMVWVLRPSCVAT